MLLNELAAQTALELIEETKTINNLDTLRIAKEMADHSASNFNGAVPEVIQLQEAIAQRINELESRTS